MPHPRQSAHWGSYSQQGESHPVPVEGPKENGCQPTGIRDDLKQHGAEED